jgi:hypothetical protein
MSAVPAARYLADFGTDGATAGGHGGSGEPARNRGTGHAAKLEEDLARGIEAGRAAAQAEFDVKLEAQQRLFAQQLAAERQAWATGAGETLANGLLAGLQELEARIAETVARILKPFVAAQLHRQAIAELQAGLDVLTSASPGASLHVSGPEDILQVVREQLAGKTMAVTYAPSEDCDVRIVAGQAMLETCLKDWLAKLEEAVR